MKSRGVMYVKTINYKSTEASQDFCDSLRETGFAIIKNHPISQSLVDTVYEDWKHFFESDSKFDFLFNPDATPQTGYFPFKSENAKGYSTKDLKEFYHYRTLKDLPKGMAENTPLLKERLIALVQELLRWIDQELPGSIAQSLSMPFAEMAQETEGSVLRILHYPPIKGKEEEGAVRAAAHEDINLLTVLPAATTPGLQVLDSKGHWHEVTCDYNSLVINAGDMLQMATKNYYKSTTHRVVNPVGEAAYKSRYSLPLFFQPLNEVRLSDTHTAGSYLQERFKENGLRPISKAA